jgi:hypothetical protein
MKRFLFVLAAVLGSMTVWGAETNPPPADAAAKYSAALEGRAAEILKVLALNDADKSARVHDLVVAQYRALNAWHSANDGKLKAAGGDTNAVAQIRASLKTLHEGFLAKLAENLAPEQVEQVKDKMTYGKVQFSMAGYLAQYPGLTATNQAAILNWLKAAREEAMDAGSAAEKTAIFQRYKGRINNYLSKQGIHAQKPEPGPAAATPPSAPVRQQ